MKSKKKNSGFNKMAILAIILVMPGLLFYFLQQKAENRYLSLPILGPKVLSGTFHSKRGVQIPDTTYHQVQSFTLLNEDSTQVVFPMENTDISIVNFFYTRCDSFCLDANMGMSKVAHVFHKMDNIKFYSVSVDSADTPEILKNYGKQFDKGNTHWQFLTGSQSDIFKISKAGFLLDAIADTTRKDTFIVSPYLVLLDSKQRIRSYYDGSDPKQIDLLVDEIKVLLTEEYRNKKLY